MLALHTAAAAALASFAALRPSILPRPAIVCMCDAANPAPSVELVDIDGDEIVFSIIDTKLQMFVNGDFVCADVDTLDYATSDGRVRQNEGEGNFQLLEGPERWGVRHFPSALGPRFKLAASAILYRDRSYGSVILKA